MAALLEGLKALGVARLIAMAAVGGVLLLMLAALALHGGSGQQMSLLYADLDPREAAQMSDQLDRAHITHEAGPDGTRMSVSTADVARARLLLAKEGLPSGGSIGYEIFDRGDSLTASQFQQTINQTRAMEGELARSIHMITGVRAARVHLVLPKREPFARDRQDAQASVVLSMAGATRMDRAGVQAVLNLVAAAVPGLRPQNISIIDSRGNLLARAGDTDVDGGGPAEQQRIAIEQRLSRAVEDLLERSLGPGRVRAEATVEMDYDQVHETKESFDPDSKVERSTQNNTTSNRTTEAASSVTVSNNLPNADAASPPSGSQEQRTEETTNYEISKTVRTTVRDQPHIQRVSLAVLVDQLPVKAADGTITWQDRSADELQRIAALARSASGLDDKRGDKLEVVSMRFTELDEAAASPKPAFLGVSFDKPDLLRLGQSAILALIAAMALLFVFRPLALRITAAPQALDVSAAAALQAAPGAPGQLALAGPAGAPGAPGAPGAAAAAEAENEDMVRLSNIDGAMRASSLRQIANLVDQHPEESLAVMRGWMTRETT